MTEWKRMIYHGEDLGDYFVISSCGEIKNVRTQHIRKQCILSSGYMSCSISLGSRSKRMCIRVHRAVAETFIPNDKMKPEVNHKDGDKTNNCVENLEWVTGKENMTHAVICGLWNPTFGDKNGISKLSKDKVDWAKSVYTPRDKKYGLRKLAEALGVDHSTLHSAITGRTWV